MLELFFLHTVSLNLKTEENCISIVLSGTIAAATA
jgi:hypothetical protein